MQRMSEKDRCGLPDIGGVNSLRKASGILAEYFKE